MGIAPTSTKIGPPRGGACRGCEPAQTYHPRIYKPPQDPCKDACGAWKKFKVRVGKNCALCVTFLNLNGGQVDGYRIFDDGTCPQYKPMGELNLTDDVCDLNIMKPGVYEFRPRDDEVFDKGFSWKTAEVSHASLANMITAGGKHVVL